MHRRQHFTEHNRRLKNSMGRLNYTLQPNRKIFNAQILHYKVFQSLQFQLRLLFKLKSIEKPKILPHITCSQRRQKTLINFAKKKWKAIYCRYSEKKLKNTTISEWILIVKRIVGNPVPFSLIDSLLVGGEEGFVDFTSIRVFGDAVARLDFSHFRVL